MTIRRRYYLSLLIVLALFFANLVAYIWSARARQSAENEWEHAIACELKLSSIRQELDNLNKEVTLASQMEEEKQTSFINQEGRNLLEQSTLAKEQEIQSLKDDASPDQLPAIEQFHKNFMELRQAWINFYLGAAKNETGAEADLLRADALVVKIFEQEIPSLQSMEGDRIKRARVDFMAAEKLGWRVMIITFILSVLIAFVLSWRLSRHLAFGFATLKHGAHLIGAMELEHRIRYPARDEFSQLADSFNDMATKLSSARQKLLQTNRQLSESETRYRNLVNRAVYGIYRCSGHRFLDVNPALVEMLGYSSKSDLLRLDMGLDVYSNPSDYRTLMEKLNSGAVEGFEVQWKTRNGETIITRLSGNVVVTEAGATECEMIAENVTEHRALEEQLRQAQKMEAVGRLAGGIAHDFNNLLTIIKGHSELLLSELKPRDATRKEVDGVMRAAERAASLTRQLLAFSRRQLLTPKILDLNAIVSNMDKMLARLLGEDVRLTTQLEPNLGLIKADPNQIEQVIMNLAVNARDAMPVGGDLYITTSNLDLKHEFRAEEICLPPGSYVMLSIKDNGMGMDAVTASRAFEPFFTTKEQGKGTGLGLSTVYGIVKQSEGEIWVESSPGKGTAFYISFPKMEQESETVAAKKRAKEVAGKETILVVEDENDVREIACTMLERRGYKVVSAASFHEAEKFCRTYSRTIHLLLTDVVLKEIGGLELAQALLTIRPEMRVIYMSGYTDDVVLEHGIRNSQVAFLPKPFTTEELASKVREVLDRVVVIVPSA
jgi:two-component system, cell cycle sensor histidine kinase and response regulator CckA